MHRQSPAIFGRGHERRRLDQWRIRRQLPGGSAVRGQCPWVQTDFLGNREERQFDGLAEEAQHHLVAGRPAHARALADGGVENPGRDPALPGQPGLEHLIPHRGGHQHEPRLGNPDGEDVERGPVDLQFLGTLVLPIGLEVLPGLRNRPHAHAVHLVPLHVFVEQLALLGFGQPAAEILGGLDDQHEERRVCPVERLRVQCVIAAAVVIDALDGLVIPTDLGSGVCGAVAVVDHAHDRVHRARHAL